VTARKSRAAPAVEKPIAVAPKQATSTKAGRAPRQRGHLAIGKRPVNAYDAATNHPLIPRVQDISHSSAARSQRPMQLLSRQMYRNEVWIRQLIEMKCKIDIGTGPVPTSRFPELDALWAVASEEFDNTGRRSHGAWLRDDVYRNFLLDGEIFIRERNRDGYEIADMLIIRTQWQVIPSHFVPHGYNQFFKGLNYRNGIATQFDRPVSFACHTSDPSEAGFDGRVFPVPASEMMQFFDPMTGALRGEVPLASILLRAIKATTLEDAELRRKHVASLTTGFFTRTAEADPDEPILSQDQVSDMLDSVELTPGGLFELPPGVDFKSFSPADEPQNFEKALRWQLLAICACLGIPSHYVTGDWSAVTERMVRFVDQGMERNSGIVRQMLERMVVNRQWRTFVDRAMEQGLWSPPAGMKSWELYRVEWEWPQLPNAAFARELSVLLQAVKDGAINMGYVSKLMFGKDHKDVQRLLAKEASRDHALGIQPVRVSWLPDASEVAARIAAETLAEEILERDIVDESGLEDSAIDDDLI
jgi:capsid protein